MHSWVDPYSGKRKSNRHYRNRRAKQRMRRLYDCGADRWYPWPVTYSNYEWDSISYQAYPAKNAHLERNWRGRRSKYLKTVAHRKARRCNHEVYNDTYHKQFDFWWELN